MLFSLFHLILKLHRRGRCPSEGASPSYLAHIWKPNVCFVFTASDHTTTHTGTRTLQFHPLLPSPSLTQNHIDQKQLMDICQDHSGCAIWPMIGTQTLNGIMT